MLKINMEQPNMFMKCQMVDSCVRGCKIEIDHCRTFLKSIDQTTAIWVPVLLSTSDPAEHSYINDFLGVCSRVRERYLERLNAALLVEQIENMNMNIVT